MRGMEGGRSSPFHKFIKMEEFMKETILKEGKELEISFTKIDSLFCRCCQEIPAAYLKNLIALKRILLRLARSSPFPLIILSGYRCENYNKKVGGEKNSPHRKGLAVDLLVKSPEERFFLIKQLLLIGISRIVLYPDLPPVLHFELPQHSLKPFFALRLKGGKDV